MGLRYFNELNGICNDELLVENELKFTHRLKKSTSEYSEHIRTGITARLLAKDKGDVIHWYETVKEVKIDDKNGKQRIVNGFSVEPNNLNVEQYKKILMPKLRDTLSLTGIEVSDLGCPIPQLNNIFVP